MPPARLTGSHDDRRGGNRTWFGARLEPLGLCSLPLLLALAGCGGAAHAPQSAPPPEATLPELAADVLKLSPTRWPLLVRAQGSLTADEITVVGAKVAGRVEEVHVDLGDEVTPQTVLLTLDRRELELAAAQAEAALLQARAAVGLPPDAPLDSLNPLASPPVREAQAVLEEVHLRRERVQRLREQRAVTETEWQEVLAAEKVAEAQLASALNAVNEKIALIRVRAAELALARQRWEDAVIAAPFCGIVQQRHVAPGSFVQVGQAIVTLVRTHPLRYRGVLPERYSQWLSIGQPVRVALPAGAEPCLTQVSRISPALDPASRSLTFEAEVDNAGGRLRAGQFAEATVELDSYRQALVVPAGAIVEFAGTEKVWKVADGRCREHRVQTGERREGWVEIVDGLSAGDVILVDGRLGREARVRPQTWLALRADAPELIVQSAPETQAVRPPPAAEPTPRRPAPPPEGEDLPSSPHAAGP